ncbi:flavin reductase family protein [Thermomonospora umbrina]|uniref:Flavin reductase (DIM6/NTAB) family NADH-FMN oxidoreductase RutF n=1 Tax=Thermomonospora umbrina TaxID=111806 RepID=A0A3D9T606_9ACTN|nr:flavin reductase family protein [Thermomonospora umbrina]REE99191.1 flavin reductase (DIM6/NTAB) family NADH-FMN oxidoreductase RutF [Thermomonospora umbrina]
MGAFAEVGVVDATRFRSVLGHYATGVVAITALDSEGRPAGLIANSFTSVSLDPPLVSFCVTHTSRTWPRLRDAGLLCVNILGARQEDVSRRMAAGGDDRFAGLAWEPSPGGAPLLKGALAWIECSVDEEHTAGDHRIVVARVHRLDTHHDGDPLLFFRGAYGTFDG